MVIAEVSIAPLGTGSTSISGYVADCHKILQQQQEVQYQLTPMGTILEGDLDAILGLIRKMHEIPFAKGAGRVSTAIKIDDRRDKNASMEKKLASVRNKI